MEYDFFSALAISDPLFTGEESHMLLPGVEMRLESDILIEFKASTMTGLLLYTAQRFSEQSGDFLALSLYNGRVDLRLSFGGDMPMILMSQSIIAKGTRMFFYITCRLKP